MSKFTSVVILVSLSLLCILEDNQVNAICCPRNSDVVYCDDGVYPGPFGCCSYGACNIFCCNCDDECRHDRSGLGVPGVLTGHSKSTSHLEAYDLDHDEHFTQEEARSYLISTNGGDESKVVDLEKHFVALDKNGDGKLSFDEIDGK